MTKGLVAVRLLALLGLFLAACGSPATPTEATRAPLPTPTEVAVAPTAVLAPPTETALPFTPPPTAPPTDAPGPPVPANRASPLGPRVTQVTIDGDPVDWAGNDVLATDPEGDHEGGGFDIAAVRAFANDRFLYVLVETHGAPEDYVQLELEVQADERSYDVVLRPEEGGSVSIGETTSGRFVPIGEVSGSLSAVGEAVEFKMPLSTFEGATGLTLMNVRPMTGECCGDDWRHGDEIGSVQVAQVQEVEAAPVVEGTPSGPRVCGEAIAPPAPADAFQPAAIQLEESGYTAEWFVAPSGFNMPQDVLLTPQGGMLVLATRSFALFRVTDDGVVTTLAEDVHGYTSDMDAQGNAYLYSQTDGTVNRVAPDGAKTMVVQSPDLVTSCTSGFGVGPDGNLYLARNLCDLGEMKKADLYRVTMEGQLERVAESIPALVALRTTPDGRLIAAAMGREVYEVSLEDFSLARLGAVPGHEGIAVGGLAPGEEGDLYISTGTWSPEGEVYRLDASGEFSLVAEIPGNGLTGIEWRSRGDIVGVQLQLGALVSVAMDGSLREIVPGNGLITPRGMAFSPCGELAVSNEEGGAMVLVDPAGAVSSFFEYNSYTSPVSFLAFDPDGTLYATEGAPGLPERVISVSPGASLPTPFLDAARPGGIVRRPDGSLVVAETVSDRIVQIDLNGVAATFADGVTRPTALALDSEGNLYAVVGTGGHPLDEYHMPDAGDAIVRFTPQGETTRLAKWTRLAGLAFAPSGDLYAGTGWDGGIVRISPDGTITPFAGGLREVTDLAFDLAGNLYASDAVLNGIVRIGGFPQGTLSGTVADGSGGPVEGARVQVLSDHPIVVGDVVTTDADGSFSLAAAPRTYAVTVTAEGHEATTQDGVQVAADRETVIDIEIGG